MTNTTWKFLSKTKSITVSCKTGSIRSRKQKQRSGRNQRMRLAYLRASFSPAARAFYKYSLELSEQDQRKPHTVINALKDYGAIIGVLGERQKFIFFLQNEENSIARLGRQRFAIELPSACMKISLLN